MTQKDQFTAILHEMTSFYRETPARVNHFLKVWSFARQIGLSEKLSDEMQFLLEITALMHDIGIKPSEEKYHSSAGNYQELEGPVIAAPMLEKYGFTAAQIDRICYLIGHHHTYTNVDGLDYQVLIEADFLVNLYEDDANRSAVMKAYENIFRTQTGRKIFREMFWDGEEP